MTCLSTNWLGGCSRWKERLLFPLSCRGRPDQHPCCPSLTIGGIRDRRFQFCTLLTDQQPRMRLATGNIRNCAMHAAAMEFPPRLEATLTPPFQCEGTLIQSNNTSASGSWNHQHHCASTHFAGRGVSTSATVADRRFQSTMHSGATTCFSDQRGLKERGLTPFPSLCSLIVYGNLDLDGWPVTPHASKLPPLSLLDIVNTTGGKVVKDFGNSQSN
jgi:hypothetical protein